MATKPTPGGTDGTYGTELNTFLDESLASDGKIKTEALQTDATAPVADAALANKKYVDDSGFQDRGDPASSDKSTWGVAFADLDGTWKDLDLNALAGVSTDAKSVLLLLQTQNNTLAESFRIRENGNSNEANVGTVRTMVVNQLNSQDVVVTLGTGAVVEYNGSNGGTWSQVALTVKGWWT